MKKIELTIKEDGYIVCTIEKNNNLSYIIFREIIEELNKINLNDCKISIENNNIKFYNNDIKVKINNYINNKDIKLDNIIEKIKKEKIKQRKKYLRNQKIKRIRTLAGVTILTGTIFTTSFLSNYFNVEALNEIKDDDVKNTQEEIINETEKEKTIANIEESNYIEEYKKIKEIQEKENKETVEIAFESRTNTDKYKITKSYYQELITNISNEYGIDPQIILAIATQEYGIHNININSPAIGLMQIERAVWNNQNVTAYNYKTQSNETTFITEEKLKDLEFNIRTACMIFQNCLKSSNYNLCVAIQMYNYGPGNIEKTFKICYGENVNLSDTFATNDTTWLQYRENIYEGDKEYLEHVLSYIENLENIKLKTNTQTICYQIIEKNLSRSL